MSRQQGTFNLSGNLEPLFDAPLDARLVVSAKSDLYAFQYYYQGMIVSVKSDDTAYLLVGNDPSQESSWKELGSTGENVATKTDLYTLQNTWRGMIVYVIDEDKYYKLVNDLPQYEASWQEYTAAGGEFNLIEMSDAEIDALFV